MKKTAFLGILAIVATALIVARGFTGDMNQRLKEAVLKDMENTRLLLSLPKELESADPQTEQELKQWTEKAQELRARMDELAKAGSVLRTETLEQLKALPSGEDCPLKSEVSDYFQAENEYFELAEQSKNQTSVVLVANGSTSVEGEKKMHSLLETSIKTLTLYDRLLSSQQALLKAANQRGWKLMPVWEQSYRTELAKGVEMLKNFKTRRPR